jgi:hypothetical protein
MAARVARVVGVVVAAALCRAPVVRAEPDAARDPALSWHAPASCPDAREVRARIEHRLGAAIDQRVSGVAVEIAVQRDGKARRFVARIDLRGLRGAAGDDEIRVLVSERCDELTDAVAVVIARIAAQIEPSARSPAEPRAATEPAGDPASERAAGASGTAQSALGADAVRARPAREAPRPWGGGVRMLALSGIGALPGVSVGGELGGYVRSRSMVIELAGMGWLDQANHIGGSGPARVDLSLQLVAIRIGWGPEDLPLRAWLTSELGTLHGEGVALGDPNVGTARWLGIGAGFSVAWPMFDRARLVGSIEVVAPVERARFMLTDGSEVYHSGLPAVRSGLGVEVGWQ